MGAEQQIQLLIQRPRIIPGATTANWNSGVATSGQPGADLITIGSANEWYRLNQFALVLTGFNALATVTMRAYMDIAGANREVLNDDWIIAASGPIAFMSWFFDAEFFGPFRVEVYSDQAADDGFNASYEYRIKDW